MKKKLIIAVVVVAVLLAGIFMFRPKSFSKEFEKVMGNLTSYTLHGEMEINKGEEQKSYLIEVNYKKGDEDDFYKVSLYDKNLNQEQILLRNLEGVFVITPSLNQIFKFEGDWPMNSPKPYLIQTMFDVMKNEEAQIEQRKDGATIITPVVYSNNKNYRIQKMEFDAEAKPITVEISDETETVQLKLVFDKVTYNHEIKDEVFTAPQHLDNSVNGGYIDESDLPMYPVSIFDSQLVSHNEMLVNGEKRHILEYTGDKNFTILQTVKQKKEETQTVFMPGEMIDTLELVGFYDGASMSAYEQNVEMTIYSQDLSPEEMMRVLASMQVAVMK